MFRVKTIVTLGITSISWLVLQQTACVKHDGGAFAAGAARGGAGSGGNGGGVEGANGGRAGGDSLSYLALGDSYTIGESVEAPQRYPVQVVDLLRRDSLHYSSPNIIAVTGWTCSNLLSAMPSPGQRPYHAVTVLIGVNDQYQHHTAADYREQFKEVLRRAIQLAGNIPSHVVVLSIPDYSVTPFARGSDRATIAKEINAFNEINKQEATAQGASWIDVTAESRMAADDPSLIAADGLHFSGKEYAIWARKVEPVLRSFR